jgi:hypothetical protein
MQWYHLYILNPYNLADSNDHSCATKTLQKKVCLIFGLGEYNVIRYFSSVQWHIRVTENLYFYVQSNTSKLVVCNFIIVCILHK